MGGAHLQRAARGVGAPSLVRFLTLFAFMCALLPAGAMGTGRSGGVIGCSPSGVGNVAALVAAINSANVNRRADTITLAAGCTYTLKKADNNSLDGATGLPVIQADKGNTLTINGNGATITRAPGGPQFRILAVAKGASVTLSQLTLSGGVALNANGGGIYNAGSLTLVDSTVSGNLARGSSGNGSAGGVGGGVGGGIFSGGQGAALTLVRSTVAANEAVGGNGVARSGGAGGGVGAGLGGGIFNQGPGGVTVVSSTLSGNRATAGPGGAGGSSPGSAGAAARRGGGSAGPALAGLGGAIFSGGGAVELSSATITANRAEGGTAIGSALYSGGGTLSYRSSIIAANGDGPDCAAGVGGLASQGFNLLGAGCAAAPSTDLVGADPLLGALAANGGPTLTHALQPGSPAIDAGDAAACPSVDQRGVARPQDGDGAGGARCDIGAVEYVSPSRTFTVGEATQAALAAAIAAANSNPGLDTIVFDPAVFLPGTQIAIAEPLPPVADPTLIDATGNPADGCAGERLVTLVGPGGAAGFDGLVLQAGGSTVCGLVIGGFGGAGISIPGAGGNTIVNNILRDNGGAGVAVGGGTGNRIQRNSIYNNGGAGIAIAAGVPAPAAPTVERVTETDAGVVVEGALAAPLAGAASVEIFANLPCDASGFGEGEIYLGTASVAAGAAGFTLPVERSPNDLAGRLITASVTDEAAGLSSAFAGCAPVRANDFWTGARQLTLAPTGASQAGAAAAQLIAHPFQERWYRFTPGPGSRIRITLTGQPGSTVSLHRNLPAVYNQLAAPQSAAELSVNALPGGFLPGGFLPGGFLPGGFLPGGFLPGGFLPGGFLPGGFLPGGFLPGGFLPGGFLPGGFLPGGFLPGGFLEIDDPNLYTGAVLASLMAYASDQNASVLSIDRLSWDLTEELYIRVTGPASAEPFSLQLTVDSGVCSAIRPVDASLPPFVAPAPAPGAALPATLILWDSQLAEGDPGALGAALGSFGARPDVAATVVDLADSGGAFPRVAAARAQLAANPACAAAANVVADEIKAVVDAYRSAYAAPGGTSLRYITLVGDDGVIPFFRYPDTAGLAGENEYSPPVQERSPTNASLRENRVLSQEGYGAERGIWRGSYELPLPDLAVGRLVGDSATVIGLLNAYIAAGGVVTPRSALVTGYDFVADGALAVRDDIARGLDAAPTTLIQPEGEPPTGPNAWTGDDLRSLLLAPQTAGQRNDLVFFTGHFDVGGLLAADYRTGVAAAEIAGAPADFTNTILFGLGCHSGLNIPGADAIAGATPDPNWAEAFAARGATYIAATGYAYGDTELVDYGERFLLNLARQLRTGTGEVAIGAARVRAAQAYLAQKPSLSGIDEKTLLQFTIYGLPMLRVNMPGARETDATSTSIVGGAAAVPAGSPGAAFGLQVGQAAAGGSTEVSVATGPLGREDVTLTNVQSGASVTATYFTGPAGETVANPIEPILPLVREDVGLAGRTLRGAVFVGGTYADLPNITPLTSAPTTEGSRGRPGFFSDVPYPSQNWGANFFGTLDGGPAQLLLVPAQYSSGAPGSFSGTMRTYGSMAFRLFYVPDGGAVPSAFKAPAPEVSSVQIGRADDGAIDAVGVYVVDEAGVGVQEVWITYTGPGSPGRWESRQLARSAADPTLWSAGGLGLPDGSVFMVQAVSATGQVGLDTNGGRYYGPRGTQSGSGAVATTLTPVTVPAQAVYGQATLFQARLLRADGSPAGGQPVTLSLGGQVEFATTDAAGLATFNLTPRQLPGQYGAEFRFLGGATLRAAQGLAQVTVVRGDARIVLSPAEAQTVTQGGAAGLGATLRVRNPDGTLGAPLPDKTVFFIVSPAEGAAFSRAVKTGQDGQALLAAGAWAAGAYSVRAYFGAASGLPVVGTIPADLFYNPAQAGPVAVTVVPAPDTTITAGPPPSTAATWASFSFAGSGGQAPLRFECSLDGAPFAACESGVAYHDLAPGAHSFRARAVDASGVADPTPAEQTWSVTGLYRARQVGERVWIERNVAAAGLGDYDGEPFDGWALVGRTNGAADNGELRGFFIAEGVPYAIIYNRSYHKGDRCILVTPKSLSKVKKGETRLVITVNHNFVPCPAGPGEEHPPTE